MYVLTILNTIKNFEISSGIKAFPECRSEGVVLPTVKWRQDLLMALGLLRTNSTNGVIHKGGQKSKKQEERVFLSAMVRRLDMVRAQSQCSGQVLGVLSFHLQRHDGRDWEPA